MKPDGTENALLFRGLGGAPAADVSGSPGGIVGNGLGWSVDGTEIVFGLGVDFHVDLYRTSPTGAEPANLSAVSRASAPFDFDQETDWC